MPNDLKLGKLTIRTDDDPCLRRKSTVVKEVGAAERMLISAMLETMYASKGVGLAAPQVGINQQIFVMDVGEDPIVVINPQVLKRSGSQCLEEGCLSLPGQVVNVKRPKKILVHYWDVQGKTVEREFSDLLARVFLHENDHLLGKLITDYRGWREKLGLKKASRKPRHQEKVI